jgi:hypothetical protein
VRQVAQLLSRVVSGTAREEGESGAATPEQWLDIVATHGLLPHLRELAADQFTPEQLASRTRSHEYRCLRLTGELLALVDLFHQHDIPAIPFKGPLLAVQLYGDAASRSYRDSDFVVREEHADRALALLVARGYEPPPELGRFPFAWWRRWVDQCRLTRDGIRIDLHWALDQRGLLPLDLDSACSGLEPVRLGGRIVHTLSREQLAVYLAAHGAKHAWMRLEWIVDFGQLVEAGTQLDWSRIARAARARGAERALLLGLRLSRDLLGVAPPAELAARVAQDRRVGALARRVEAGLYGERPLRHGTRRLQLFHLQVQERLRDRARYLTRLLFASGPSDWALIRLPNRLSWLYAFIKPLRLAAGVVGVLLEQSEAWLGI